MDNGLIAGLLILTAGAGVAWALWPKPAQGAVDNSAPAEAKKSFVDRARENLSGLRLPSVFTNLRPWNSSNGSAQENYEKILPDLRAEHVKGVDPLLIEIMREARYRARKDPNVLDFELSDGMRTENEQRILYESGKSRTMRSKHLVGLAVDIFAINPDGSANWDFNEYKKINDIVQQVAKEKTNRKVTWGGSWRSFKDGPHFEIQETKLAGL